MSIKDLPRWLLPAVLGVAALVLIMILVLGGGDDDAAEGPAAVVPASAPVYIDLSLRPEGEAKESAEAALGTILGTQDPGAEVISLIEEQAKKEGEDFDYEAEIEPWLGEHFGIFLTKIAPDDESEGGFIFETTDSGEALDFISSQGDEDSGEEKEYEGVEYTIDEDGDAFGLVEDFVVGGDEAAFKAAVDASDGDSLAESDEFNDSIDELAPDRLAPLYVPIDKVLDSVSAEDLGTQERAFIEGLLGDAAEEPILGQMTASATDVSFELSVAGGEVETAESSLLEDLPAEAWLAVGLGDVGSAIDQGIDTLDQGGLESEAIESQLRAQTGIDLDALTAALGEAAFFVKGRTVADLGGALVIQDKDQTVTANLLDRLQTLIAQQSQGTVKVQPLAGAAAGFQLVDPSGELKQPIQVVQTSGKIVAGYGADSVQQAAAIADSPKTLADEPGFENARTAVGDLGVDAFLSIEPILALAESEGVASDADYQQAKPYLDGLAFIAIGSGSDGDRSAVRFVIGLR